MEHPEINHDELAQMIRAGFDAVDERFEKMDARFDRIETDLAEMKEGRVRRFEFDELERRVDVLETKAQPATN